MDGLTQIASILKPSEIQWIRKFYGSQPNGEEKRRLELFNLIIKNKGISNEDAVKKLYNKNQSSAFSHLKRRLKTDILNFMLIQDIGRITNNSTIKSQFLCRVKLFQGQLLMQRGLFNEAVQILNKAKKITEENEYYYENIIILDLLKRHIGYRKGKAGYDKYNETYFSLIQEAFYLDKAKECYFSIFLPHQFKTNKYSIYLEKSKTLLAFLEDIKSKTQGESFWYYYLLANIFYSNRISKDFSNALNLANKFMELVNNSSIFQGDSFYASAYIYLCDTHLNLNNYDNVIKYSNLALERFRPKMINYLTTLEYLFIGQLRKKEFQDALETIRNAYEHRQITLNKLLKARWLYYEANVTYLLGDTDKTYDLLLSNREILKDKTGWLLGYKLLEMMLIIDEDDHYRLSYYVDNFAHLLNRNKQANVKRGKAIVKILRLLMKHRGDLKDTYRAAVKPLLLLKEGEGDYYWDPKGYEVIRFDEWLEARALA